ncbi:MAG: RIP metalloprotease RseP [Proteobacteria bacterium]|nr:RIP metalloprotease RseP [Pseudomonadota bacterium]
MVSALTNLLAFIAAISILVAVHEYGHYLVGRWVGMKVLRFSIGFGRPVWTRIAGKDRTEYCISAIPLGGYVRFLDSREGPIDAEDEGRAFNQRPIPARVLVLLAGPAFNFIFAIVAYWALLAGGIMVLTPAVGSVTPESYAATAGLRFGDKIVAVGDTDTTDWESTLVAILGEMVSDGRIPLTLESEAGGRRTATIIVGDDKTRLTEPGVLFDGLGFQPWQPPAIVGEITDGGAAAAAGLAVGDRITAIDTEPVGNFNELRAVVGPRPNQEVSVEYVREGRTESVNVMLGEHDIDGETRGLLGIALSESAGDYYQLRTFTPYESLREAATKTWTSTLFTMQMLGRMATGDVSIKNISGPINIAQFAGDSAQRGIRSFLAFLAVISISLGVLNLLPVPVLDGGQIVYQLVEMIKGSPMTERAQILGQQAGILALLLLMSFAFYNDIARILS